MNAEIYRIEKKLKLWEAPGFLGFLEDLQRQKGIECNILGEVEVVRKLYLKRLSEISHKSKYTQGKIF